jgi:hypothetical protein
MPKPTRRERRQLAEKGKLAPRRQAVQSTTSAVSASAKAERLAAPKVKTTAAEEAMSAAQEYGYVKADLMRILVLAAVLVSTMIGLRVVLPQ